MPVFLLSLYSVSVSWCQRFRGLYIFMLNSVITERFGQPFLDLAGFCGILVSSDPKIGQIPKSPGLIWLLCLFMHILCGGIPGICRMFSERMFLGRLFTERIFTGRMLPGRILSGRIFQAGYFQAGYFQAEYFQAENFQWGF